MDNENIKTEPLEVNEDAIEEIINPQDSRWSCVILLCCFLIQLIVHGIIYSIAVICKKNIHYYDEHFSLFLTVYVLVSLSIVLGPLLSLIMVKRFGCRPLITIGSLVVSLCTFFVFFAKDYLVLQHIFSLIGGIGILFIYFPSFLSLTIYFEKYRPIATGLTLSGTAIGSILFSTLAEYDKEKIVLHYSFFILLCAPLGLFFRPVKFLETMQQESRYTDFVTKKGQSIIPLFKNSVFIVISISIFFFALSLIASSILIFQKTEELTDLQTKHLLILALAINTIGRIIFGFIGNIPKVNRLYLFNACIMICGIATAILVFCQEYYMVQIYVVISGLTMGCCTTLTSLILVDSLGLPEFSNAFSLISILKGITIVICLPFIVWFYFNSSKSANKIWILASIIITNCGLLLFLIPVVQKVEKRFPICTKDLFASKKCVKLTIRPKEFPA